MNKLELKVSGMHCGSCEMLIEMAVSELSGVQGVKADSGRGTVVVEHDAVATGSDEIKAAITGAGYEVTG